jgi:acylphosphatase
VSGRVQGVGFRFFVEEKARQLELTGWVRNLPDGRVECEAEGPRDILELWIEELKKGPLLSRVEHISVQWQTFTQKFSCFEIRP